ncbi:diguanylate cyclase (GGDEF) domain-containing protein [Clostridium cavendishii DSM 21758]|uniref:Diguanylate cyclase (GGDEF) domain-containing protein n=1 Tax=Clostridium cavendishii DSM 21758 TaxID=1121302 RepID=A0A1M6T821_9CLOT|nr:GGDEF domain-containing protein [Clostridium cavendishii]SHK52908.1 diguanylate cyclase (GGDEF) domain-containing protein [Clostridium cavendishii DSM 21758]
MKKLSSKKFLFLISFTGVLIILLVISFFFKNISKVTYYNKIEDEKKIYKKQSEYKKSQKKFIIKDTDKEIEILNKQLAKSNNDLDKGLICEMLYYCYVVKDDLYKQKEFYLLAEEKYKGSEYGKPFLFSMYKNMVNDFLDYKNYKEALSILYKSIELLNDDSGHVKAILDYTDDDVDIMISYNFLQIFSDNNVISKADEYLDKLNKYDEEKLDVYTRLKVSTAKLKYYTMKKNIQKQKEYADKLYRNASLYDKENGTDIVNWIIIDIIEAKLNSNETNNVLEELKTGESFFIKNNNKKYLASIYEFYGEYYDKINDFDNSILYYNNAIKLYIDNKERVYVADLCQKIIKLNEKNNREANINYYKQYMNSMSEKETNQNIKNLISMAMDINNSSNSQKINEINKEKKEIELKDTFKNLFIIVLIVFLITLSLVLKRLFSEMRKRKLSEERLEEMVKVDYLTKAHAKGYGYSLLKSLIYSKEEFYMAVIDVDNFKSINDNYGHVFGDKILKTISNKIKRIIGENDFLIRFGGEEFILVIRNKSEIEAFNLIEDCRRTIEEVSLKNDDGNEVKITVSIGFSKYTNEELDEFIIKVDKLLYKAKSSGKNRIEM